MKEFVEKGVNASSVAEAVKQEQQLIYFTRSEIQADYPFINNLQNWLDRNYTTGDAFMDYVKSVFKPDIAIKYFKFLRKPVVSAKIVNQRIIPSLKRVFHAEDSTFNYVVEGIEDSEFNKDLMDPETFQLLFKNLLFYHNSIHVTDVSANGDNMPLQFFIRIHKVRSIEVDEKGNIVAIAYRSCLIDSEGKEIKGFTYIDDKAYKFYTEEKYIEIVNNPHDLGYCPARFISTDWIEDTKVVRKSIFSYIRPDMEEYVFLKTIQRMVEPNGAIPVAFRLDFEEETAGPETPGPENQPAGDGIMGAKTPERTSSTNGINPGEGLLNPGQIFDIPINQDVDGKIDSDVVQNMFHWVFIPTEQLEYLDKRIKDIEQAIVMAIIGDTIGQTEQPQNELQVQKSLTILQNTLRELSQNLSTVKTGTDRDYLNVRYGPTMVKFVQAYFGSDFFIETEDMLLKKLEKAPNPVERKNLLIRINANKFHKNPMKLGRMKILYNLLPFTVDADFNKAVAHELVDEPTKKLQLQFDYYINIFEATYGDIVEFFNEMENQTVAERYVVIKNLLNQIINDESSSTSTPD
jgi:hypothetical protein